MPLFEVAIIEHPSKKDKEDGASEKLIFGPTPVVSKDGHSAAISVILDNAEKFSAIDRSRMEVLVRPFAKS